MTTGREALHRIDESIAEARRRLSGASDIAARDAARAAGVAQRELESFRALAELRIGDLKDGAILTGLGAADRRARELVAAHGEKAGELAAAREAAAETVARLERERRAAEADHDDHVARHEAAVAATMTRLESDPDYDRLAGAAEDGEAVARRAAHKLETARADRAEKGAPYEADPLFAYLTRRKFGTRDYRAFPLFALLDRWVAGLVGYRGAKANYDRLLEIPERLAEHAAAVDAAAARLKDALEAYERDALERDGAGRLREAAAAARQRLEALDATIAEAEKAHEAAATAFSETAAGRAGPIEEARALLASALGEKAIPDLRLLAAETAGLEDDRIVGELISLKRERFELEEARAAEARSLAGHGRKLNELEDLRRRFKGARFDSPYSEFPGEDFIGALIVEFLGGALARDDFWRRIERGHRVRRRRWDDDAGGDFWRDPIGRPRSRRSGEGTSWPSPGPGVPSGRTPRIPRTPRSGGFRTGGGFGRGGGGLKTGGGF
jgi:hypothetical protein